MKHTRVAAFGVAAAFALSLAACTAAPGTTAPTSTPTVGPASSSNPRLYSRNDLQNVLTAVNVKLGAGGTVGTREGANTDAVDAIPAFLAGTTTTFAPSQCADLVQSDAQLVSPLGPSGTISGTLTSSRATVIVTSLSGRSLPATFVTTFGAAQKSFLASCKHLDIDQEAGGQSNSVSIDFTPVAVTTDADNSVAFIENAEIVSSHGGSKSSRTTIEAIDGNLVIFVSGVLDHDVPSLEKTVNAVVAAALK